jgi:bacterioferritin B
VPAQRFVDALYKQIGHEFAASQQYVACAVYYDAQTLPRLASFFYVQAKEEREHAMMMVRYLLDTDDTPPKIPAIDTPKQDFSSFVEPIELALEQEKTVGQQISDLVGVARDEKDYLSEQFVQWFLREQVEEVSLMQSLLDVARRAGEQPLFVEEFLAREPIRGEEDPTAPPVAGE